MRLRGEILLLAVLLLAGCAQQGGGPSVEAAPGAAQWRGEPVIYNGRRYMVHFRVLNARERLARVRAPGRRLGTTAGDERIVAQIAASTVGHFSCREGQRARVKPGSARAQGGVWTMVVQCRPQGNSS